MKKLILALACLSSTAFAETSMICTSKDFNPADYVGQSLQVTLDGDRVVAVEKMKGSWYCDSGKVNFPKQLASNAKSDVYDVNFQCDENDGRLILSHTHKTATYTFHDPEAGTVVSYLICK